ncbi:transcriptional regulator [Maritimibacter sp. 55A14]|uniref:helix-turn-helix domain-containing protein n=1 Tax=Maritimibacter sp. 55A14 TaxID=2174844 RepID=UPI000D614FC3|nr:helix-turn-helix domain-containing protein [Maritimibacter sp. 55A14]PWE30601.1 transcriptional regulator [Maritimibacter sp. 55A14]
MDNIDTLVGARIKERRLAVGKSQRDLGDAIGVRFQQVQKYEAGKNRVSSSKLWEISRVLDVPIGYFFQDCSNPSTGVSTPETRFEGDPMVDAEARQLASAFLRMPDERRKALLNLARVMRG